MNNVVNEVVVVNEFGTKLSALRKELKLTQEEVAKRIGVTPGYVSALEKGKKPPPPLALVKVLARALGDEEEQLWQVARKEREERLLKRIEGESTAFRKSLQAIAPSQDLEDDPRVAPLDSDMLEEIASDPELAQTLYRLKKAVPNPEQREMLLKAIEGMLKTV